MRRIYKINTESFQVALTTYPYVFSIRNYAYFFTKEEWESIPFVNNQLSFNLETQDLVVQIFEESPGVVRRRWEIQPKQEETFEILSNGEAENVEEN